MHREKNKPVLYLLLRNDMATMDVGRMTVAASHVTSQFMGDVFLNGVPAISSPSSPFRTQRAAFLHQMVLQWGGAKMVGNTVTVEANGAQIENLRKMMTEWVEYTCKRKENRCPPFFAATNSVYDDCYPVRDGDVVHFPKTLIGAYVFGIRGELEHVMSKAPLIDHLSPWQAKERLFEEEQRIAAYEEVIDGLTGANASLDISLE